MSNLGLERYLASLGLTLERTAVGDRYVIERMREQASMSAASSRATSSCPTIRRPATAWSRRCRCWPVVQKLGKPVSEVCHRFEPLPQVLRNVRFSGGRPLGAIRR